jgi:hypothetical protein
MDMCGGLHCVQDVEDQATAGLDLAMSEALAALSNATSVQKTQVRAWLCLCDSEAHSPQYLQMSKTLAALSMAASFEETQVRARPTR